MTNNTYVPWLRKMEAKGGDGVVDTRDLGFIADEIEFLRSQLAPVAGCCSECGRPNKPKLRPLNKILAEVAAEHRVTIAALMPDDRRKPLVYARWHYFYRAVAETKASLRTIGEVCGDRDHTSVNYGASAWALRNGLEPARGAGLDVRAKRQTRAAFVARRSVERRAA